MSDQHLLVTMAQDLAVLRTDVAATKATSIETLAEAKKTNGRVNELEGKAREQHVRLQNLEREVFHRRKRAGADAEPEAASAETKSLTRREVAVFVAGVLATVGALKLLGLLG